MVKENAVNVTVTLEVEMVEYLDQLADQNDSNRSYELRQILRKLI